MIIAIVYYAFSFNIEWVASDNARPIHKVDLLLQVVQIQSHTLEKLNPRLNQDLLELENILDILENDPKETERRLNKLQQNLASLLPMEITMSDLQQHILHKDTCTWHSQPFYTHNRGYKMCQMVDANGYGDGCGTHVSVFLHLMRGEFDDELNWPLRGKFTVQILNKKQAYVKNMGHAARTLYFNDSMTSNANQRVTEGERSRSAWGFHRFISHSRLWPNYLKEGSVRFYISYTFQQN